MKNELEERSQKENYVSRKEWSMWQLKQKGAGKQDLAVFFHQGQGRGSKSESHGSD